MAIKIIKKGSLDNSPTFTRTCPNCKTKFTYDWTDTIQCNWLGGYQAILCPLCKYPVAHLIAGGGPDINHPLIED